MKPVFSTARLVCLLFPLAVLAPMQWAAACDLCAVYTARESERSAAGSIRLGVSEQFSRYSGTADEFAALSPVFLKEQELRSSITQLFAKYSVTDTFALQATLPYIYREYDRLERGRMKSGDEYGFGDLSLLVSFSPLAHREGEFLAFLHLYSGIKLPTGDDDRLAEEQDEEELNLLAPLSHGPPTGNLVDGADLALGSGSVDFPLGASFVLQYDRYFLQGEIQLALRTEGGHDFQYGNGLYFHAGPGVHFFLEHAFSAALGLKLSGDFKDEDRLSGSSIARSAQNQLFLGPELAITLGENWNFFAGVDFSVKHDDDSRGVQPDDRIRAGFSARF